jgi:hypothetical protein
VKEGVAVTMDSEEEIIEEGCGTCRIEDGKYVCDGIEETMTCFWATNITDNTDKFDFDRNRREIDYQVERKLVEHGLLGWERYADMIEDIYMEPEIRDLVIKSPQARVHIDEKELRNTLYKHITDRLEEGYGAVNEFEELKEIHSKLEDWEDLSKEEKVLTFDEAIHAYHLTGHVMGVDVERIREKFEENIEI